MARSAVMNFMKQQGFTQEPFENFYNRFVARRRGRPPLTPSRDKAVVEILEQIGRAHV